jgi:hypothetical protein
MKFEHSQRFKPSPSMGEGWVRVNVVTFSMQQFPTKTPIAITLESL